MEMLYRSKHGMTLSERKRFAIRGKPPTLKECRFKNFIRM